MNFNCRRVTVIIPVFNRVKLIKEAVDSVLSQDYAPIDLIVVDDGSSDGTLEWLQRIDREGALRLFCHPNRANRGQSASINLGLSEARGDYVAILDSDDGFAYGAIARHAEFLNRHLNVGMVYGNGMAIDLDGNPLGFNTLKDGHLETGDPNKLLMDCYVALPGGSMVRKEIYQKVGGFDESFRASQDHDMALRIFEATKVAYIPEIAFYYRKHKGSISTNALERRWRTGFEILRRAKVRYPYRPDVLRKRAAVLNFRLGQTLWRERKVITALPYLMKSGLLDPIRAVRVVSGKEAL